MAKYDKQTFTGQSIVIDGNDYTGCHFNGCMLVFTGAALPNLVGNKFTDCMYVFDGPAARTIQFMAALYGGGWQPIIEATFDNIRGKPGVGVKIN
jgi:hypothetical protein